MNDRASSAAPAVLSPAGAVGPGDQGSGKWMALVAAFLGWMFDGVEMGLFPTVARPALIEMLGPGSDKDGRFLIWNAWITAAFLVGAALGGVVFGWLGDRVGRVRAMALSVLVYSIFSGLCGFAPTPLAMGSLRFLAAIGMGGEWALGVALVMETWPATSRPTLAGLIGGASNVGFALTGLMSLFLVNIAGWLERTLRSTGIGDNGIDWLLGHAAANGTRSGWRLLLFLGASPAILTVLIQLFVPESKKWKHSAATATRKNRVADIFAPGLARLTVLATLIAGVSLLVTWGSVQQIGPWAGKFADPDYKSRAIALCVTFSGLGAVVGTMLAAWLAQLTNRRVAYMVITVVALISCQVLFRTPADYWNQHWSRFYLWVFIVGGVTASVYGWIPLYLPELFPTRIRATAQGFAYNMARVLSAIGTVATASVFAKLSGSEFAPVLATISLIYILGLVIIWFCPETKGKPLPE